MRVRLIPIPIPAFLKVSTTICSAHTMFSKAGKIRTKRSLSMLLIMLLLSCTTTALVGVFLVQNLVLLEANASPDLSPVKPLVFVDPEFTELSVGDTFTMYVKVFNLTDNYVRDPVDPKVMHPLGNLYGFDIRFAWDPAILAYDSHIVHVPVETYYDGVLYEPVMSVKDEVSSAQGTFTAVYTSTSPAGVFNIPDQEAIIFEMTFRVIRTGACDLKLTSISLSTDKLGEAILFDSRDGRFQTPGVPVAPIAAFTYSPSEPVVDQWVAFDASASYDPDGTIIVYQWDFGDGSPPMSIVGDPFITHEYNRGGTFTVTLTVTDNDGLKGSKTKSIAILKLPSAISISAPASVKIGGSATISGAVSPSRAWVKVTIWLRPQGAEWWGVLSFTATNEYGEYSYNWHTSSLGAYELKASWTGDDKYEGSESEIITVNVFLHQPKIEISPALGSVGTRVEVNGTGFPVNFFIYLTFDDQLVGFLFTDQQGDFSASFNLPLSASGVHKVKAWTVFYYPSTHMLSAEASFTVIDLATLDVNADVGSIFFKQETAEFDVQTTFKGVAVNATSISARLRKPDNTEETLTPQLIATGLYRIRYLIAGKGTMTGTYTLVVEADYVSETLSAHGTTIKTFLVKPTWERELPRMAAFSVASIGLIFAMTLLWRKERKKFL